MCADYLGVSQVVAIMTIPFLAVSRWCRHGEIGHLSNTQTAITEPWALAKMMTGNLEDGDLVRLCQQELLSSLPEMRAGCTCSCAHT
jgi:hypothetical protein